MCTIRMSFVKGKDHFIETTFHFNDWGFSICHEERLIIFKSKSGLSAL